MSSFSQPISGEDAAKIRVAAEEAVKGIPGAHELGRGDIDSIIAQIGGQNISLADRMAMAGTLAKSIAEAQSAKPINLISATTADIAAKREWLGLQGFGRDGRPGGPRGNTDGSAAGDGATSAVKASGASDPVFLRTLGLGSGTASALAGMGFTSQAQVQALVHDADTLGIDRNKSVVALGMMKSDDPLNYGSHMNFLSHDYKEGVQNIARMDGQIEKETDPAKKAAMIQKRDEAKAELEAKRQHERAKSNGHSKAQQGFDATSRAIDQEFKNNVPALAPNDPAATKKNMSAIDDYARHPDDAAKRNNYSPIIKSAANAADARTRGAALKVDKAVDDKIKLDAKVEEKNATNTNLVASTHSERVEAKAATADATSVRTEAQSAKADMFADLAGDAPPATKDAKAETKLPATKSADKEPKKPEPNKPAPKAKVAGMAPAPAA